MPASAFICGLSGERLKDDERQFLRASEPAGIILFGRNCTTRNQIYRLISEARDAIGREDTLVLVDQEGERVSRLKPPEWRPLIDAMEIADMAERDWSGALQTATALARLIAHDLREVGFNTACGPVLDMPTEDAHDIIGSRAFGRDLDTIIPLAHAFAEGLAELGVCPVGKHVPGHGRARSDTHHELAIVEVERETLAATDFAPFRAFSRLPAMMTAHVVFADIDDTEPASTSARVHTEVIRGD
ncbi:MAG: glycoside hydrolase family 3 N-terminal domain-containing protein, partial [Pseudomonadota bacterium]